MTIRYWDRRYRTRPELGSGAGSEGARAEWKARWVNQVAVGAVLDVGCGDGRQAALYDLADYLGYDPSAEALALARERLAYTFTDEPPEPRDTHLSMDVIHHLMTEDEYDEHMRLVFSAAEVVVVCAPAYIERPARHMRHWDWMDDTHGWTVESTDRWDDTALRVYKR